MFLSDLVFQAVIAFIWAVVQWPFSVLASLAAGALSK